MRITQIEVSYRLTESAEWNKVQVERRMVAEFPTKPADGRIDVIDSANLGAGFSRLLLGECRAACERDVDAWLEQHGQSPRYYRGPRYVAWYSYRSVLVVLPVGERPSPDIGWYALSPEAGMRLTAVRRLARAWVRTRIDHDRWLVCTRPACAAEFLKYVAERLEDGQAEADEEQGGEWVEDAEDDTEEEHD